MNKYGIVKRTIMALSFLAIIVALSSFGSGCSAGGDPERNTGFQGSWTGEVDKDNSVELTLQQTGTSTLKYNGLRGCTLTVEQKVKGSDREYSITNSSGGVCDGFFPGNLSLRKQGDNALSYELTGVTPPKKSEKGKLTLSPHSK